MFQFSERTLHIIIEIALLAALYFILTAKQNHARAILEERVHDLEEKLAIIEQYLTQGAPAPPPTVFVAARARPNARPSAQPTLEEVIEESEPEPEVELEPESKPVSDPGQSLVLQATELKQEQDGSNNNITYTLSSTHSPDLQP